MDILGNILELKGGVDFWDIDENTKSNRWIAIGRHNIQAASRLETLGDDREERIMNLVGLMLSESILPLAIKEYGEITASSIRLILAQDTMDEFSRYDWKAIVLKAFPNDGFTEDQLTQIAKMMEKIPALILEGMVDLVSKFSLLKPEVIPQIAMTLSEMVKEVNYADQSRLN